MRLGKDPLKVAKMRLGWGAQRVGMDLGIPQQFSNERTLPAADEAAVRPASLGTAGSFSYLFADVRREDWGILAYWRQLCRGERASGGEIAGATGIAIQSRTDRRCAA